MKKLLNRAALAWLLILALIVSTLPIGLSSASAASDTAAALRQAGQVLLKNGISSDWDAIAAAQAGLDIPSSYGTKLKKTIQTEASSYSKVTDLERAALAVTAIGENAASFGGVNLIERIYTSTRMTSQGVNGPIYALLALDFGSYEIPPSAKWTREALVSELLGSQRKDGSYAFEGETAGSPDLTGVALTALAPYLDKPEVKQAADSITAWLSKQQDKDGGYTSYGESSSESVAQVLIGLTSAGVDPESSPFIKNGKGLLDKLFTFHNTDGSFSHSLPLAANPYGAYQSVQALAAYEKLKAGSSRLYTKPAPAVSVTVEGPSSTITVRAAQAENALAALTGAAASASIEVKLESTQFGSYVASIGGIAGGVYGGYDGWMYTVQRHGSWITPSVGMAEFKLEKDDRLVVYYGDNTQLISSITSSPRQPRDNESFSVQINQQSWDYETNAYTTAPAADVRVKVGSATVTTDTYGIAQFQAMKAGSYDLTVTGYNETKAPSVLKQIQKLTIGSTTTRFADEGEISSWAQLAVHNSYASGLISGVGGTEATFAPRQLLTRAEFASMIVRLLDLKVESGHTAFSDVKSGSWYEEAVNTAAASGILTGTGEGRFQPESPISRQDMAVVFARALKLDLNDKSSGEMKDIKSVSAYAAASVNAVLSSELMRGDSNGSFNPQASVTREMAAVVIMNAYESTLISKIKA